MIATHDYDESFNEIAAGKTAHIMRNLVHVVPLSVLWGDNVVYLKRRDGVVLASRQDSAHGASYESIALACNGYADLAREVESLKASVINARDAMKAASLEIERLRKVNERLTDLLSSVHDYLLPFSDVKDGSYGEQHPNEAMSLLQQINEVLPKG